MADNVSGIVSATLAGYTSTSLSVSSSDVLSDVTGYGIDCPDCPDCPPVTNCEEIIDEKISSLKTSSPYASISSGQYYNQLFIKLLCNDINAKIYYTLDGSTPNLQSPRCNVGNGFTFSTIGTIVIKCFALSVSQLPSEIVEYEYDILNKKKSINSPSTQIKTKKPFVSVPSGKYYEEIQVNFNCATPNAIIYYTLDGTDPTASSSHFKANTTLTFTTIGYVYVRCFALAYSLLSSDIVEFKYEILENKNFNITATNEDEAYLDTLPNIIEPTSQKGVELYVDLTQYIPEKLREKDDFMDLIFLFQDYMNNGFREIPSPYTDITYSYHSTCSYAYNKTYREYRQPYNHTIDIIMDAENASLDIDNPTFVETYDKDRDITTYGIDDDSLEAYQSTYSSELTSGIFYDQMTYYKNIDYFKSTIIAKKINYPFNIFISTTDSYVYNNSDLETQFMLKNEMISNFGSINASGKIYLYFCNYDDFESNFSYSGSYVVEETFYPTFEYKADAYNTSDDVCSFAGTYSSKAALLSVINSSTNRFRISIDFSGTIESLDEYTLSNSPVSLYLTINSSSDLSAFSGSYPILAPRFLVIYQWQSPDIFYNYFSSQNDIRIKDKRHTILEKIHRIAYAKDPEVIDIEFIEFIAQQMGYNLMIDREDIDENDYYSSKSDKENALREILRNLPNFYRIKCTRSGLEALLLSFGIVGDLVYLYTIGNENEKGYADFINSELIEGHSDTSQYTSEENESFQSERLSNAALSSTVAQDWFPSPHFRVELDLLKQNLRLDKNRLGISLINKAVKNTKPINTVFQGFYGKMMSNFGYIFVHKPKGLMKVYARNATVESCIVVDTWNKKCSS